MGRKKWVKAGRERGQFFALPHAVLGSNSYLSLPAYGVRLLNDLGFQYKGDNNGSLCAAWKVMRGRGWRSQDTLNKAKRELLDSGLLFETRKGARPNRATLYALTFFQYDYDPRIHDVEPRAFPFGAWKSKDPLPPAIKIRPLTTAGVVGERA